MKTNINTRLYFGFASAVFLVLMVGFISYITFSLQIKEADSVKHTYKVINEVAQLQNLIVDMQTARRGFRSTNKKIYLQPYYDGLQKLQPALNDVHLLVKDNNTQTKNLKNTEQSINSLLEYWRSLGDDAGDYTREIISDIVAEEKVRMDKVREDLHVMTEVEMGLLKTREEANRKSVNLATYELVFGIMLIVLIVGILIYLILDEFKNRKTAETALLENNKKLADVYNASAENNWILAGLADVNDSLQGLTGTGELCEIILERTVSYLKVHAGAMYLFANDELMLCASIGMPANTKKTYKINEGFVGRAAVNPKPLHIKEIPAKWLLIEGGAIAADPAEVIYASLNLSGELKGVIELVTFEKFEERHAELLKLLSNNIAVALNSAQSREKVLQLLEKVQQQKEELETQQEELRQANEELNMQTEVLQSSEEELRVQEEELRQMNAELQQKNEAVVSATNALQLKAKELENTSKYKSEFLANMSHELRTPLNSVLILAKLLSDNVEHNLTEKQVSHAKIIYKSGSDLLQLINDILDLAKIEAGKVDVNIEEVSIAAVAADMEQLFTVMAEEKGIQFNTIIDPYLPKTIATDKQKVEQVLKNLLSNAIKFTAQRGEVKLIFAKDYMNETEMLTIRVQDNGIGISPGKQQLIFDAFQQADGSTSRKFGGTGLGLSITKELARLLKAEISVESEAGKGSTFSIHLPFTTAGVAKQLTSNENGTLIPKQAVQVVEQKVISDDRDEINPGDNIMLIIEDDQVFASIIRDLARTKGYKALVAIRGDEGLHYAIRYKPRAIILDMKLPGIGGPELLKELKSNKEIKHIPVHIVSGHDEKLVDASNALSFLKKPVQQKDLEDAFNLIGEYLQSSVKKVLLLSGQHLKDQLLSHMNHQKQFDVVCDLAGSVDESLNMIRDTKYDCVIADIGSNIEEGIVNLKKLHTALEPLNIPVIIYLDKDISLTDEMELKKVSEVIVRESSYSHSRLVDELDLFLYKVNGSKLVVPTRQAASSIINNNDLKSKKVLLVDDDMRNIFALTAALENEEMNISTAGDGREAVDALHENPDVDIVLMDIMMPQMDGYEAMQYIRNELKLTKLPIIALTAKAMAGDREKCIQAGASDYITKPVDTQKLVSLMRVWLS